MSSVKYHDHIQQGTSDWLNLRCGIITASRVKELASLTGKIFNSEKKKSYLYELASQRITKHVPLAYLGRDMKRGIFEEPIARAIYHENYNKVTQTGFITNDIFGFKLGYSPDGIISDEGLIEIKSASQKKQTKTICHDQVPKDHIFQIQAGMLISQRDWCDFISYSSGMNMLVKRVYKDNEIQDIIIDACTLAESEIKGICETYYRVIKDNPNRFLETERVINLEEEIEL